MSRFLARAATTAACVAIVLLIALLVLLWTGVRSGSISAKLTHPDIRNETVNSQGHGSYEEPARTRAADIASETSIMFDRIQHRFDVKPKTSWEQENATNGVGSESAIDIEGHDLPSRSFAEGFPTADGNVEHISPKKIQQNIYEDPADSINATANRIHTGHFRHSSAAIWDPHPQYEFKAFGKDFHLLLSQDSSFVSPEVKVTHIGGNSSRREHPGHQLSCFYTGTIKDDPKSVVSVSLCHGMRGHIRTSTGNYLIEPVDRQKHGQDPADKPVLHVIYLASATRSNSNSVNLPDDRNGDNDCVLIDTIHEEAPALLTDDTSLNKIYVGEHPRERRSVQTKTSMDESVEDFQQFVRHNERRQFSRRHEHPSNRYYANERRHYPVQRYRESEVEDPFETWRPRRALPQEYFIEIMVVADAKMVEYHGDGLLDYILMLMSTVSRIYKDPSIGNPISIAVVKITKTAETFGRKYPNSAGIAASEMLKGFCLWQKHMNTPDISAPEHHDTALLLTRENLCHSTEEQRCDTLGLAELGRMCTPRASCAIVQDNGLAAAFTIAHEIGHVLSMPHDDDLKCKQFRGNKKFHNVMSRMLDDNTFPWEWSNCSRHYVTDFLDSGYGNCLLDAPSTTVDQPKRAQLPGESYSENKQCELVFGSGSKICPYMAVCRRLWCTAPVWDQEQQCHTQHMPWADGTACAIGKWCHRGECVSRRNLKPIDGQWSAWGEFGGCSRTCGGGVMKRYRECNNPLPQNGGNYCIGARVKYRSCGTQDCPSGSQDFREEQCAEFDGDNRGIRNLPRDVKWHAKYTRIQPQDRCKLYCLVENTNNYFMLRDKVIDGTPCGLDTFHICVNGMCKAAGCDHVLNSTAELDTCGVCEGDNSSCQQIRGSYNISRYGYNLVTRIPAGSSYIDIRQDGWRGSNNDSNYLALRNGENQEYILNGKYMVSHHRVIIQPGITMEYSGPESAIERLNSSRPIKFDLILEILSVGNLYPPQISYEYTVPKKILASFTWVLSGWSACSRSCQGTQYRVAECRSTDNKDVVPRDYCRAEDKPREDSKRCNLDCNVQWVVISESECSNHCGPGTRTVTSQCRYHHLSSPLSSSRQYPDHTCKHLERPAERQACVGPCDDAHWLYGEWGPCSATCRGGVQTRTAMCVDSGGHSVPESKCNPQNVMLRRNCAQVACPRWGLGEPTPCSVTCGKGVREQPYFCQIEGRIVSTQYCRSPAPVTQESCDMGPCPSWQLGDWSPCSVTCGQGITRQEVSCQGANGASSFCDPSAMPQTNTRACILQACPVPTTSTTPVPYVSDRDEYHTRSHDNEIDSISFRPGYKWRLGNFGECSQPCNGGYKDRAVKCSSAETGAIVPDDYCDKNQKPPATTLCNPHACPRWNTGDWSQCNSECGPGFRHRQVQCQTHRGETLPDKDCSTPAKPRHFEECSKPACGSGTQQVTGKSRGPKTASPGAPKPYKWRMTKWTRCSKTCGYGTKMRSVECIPNTSNGDATPVDEQKCLRLARKPKSQRQCQRVPCALTWQAGTWTECSAKCGNGMQRRGVSCHRVNRFGWIDPAPASGCKLSDRPPVEQRCKLGECDDEYHWVPGPWQKCSHPCGRKGKQIRRLFCHDRDDKKVARMYCPAKFRPQRRRKCNQKRCGSVSCLEAKQKYKSIEDKEYSLLIGGKIMSIYCHNMMGQHPLEYLTLPSGDRENFALIYDQRLVDPRNCPSGDRRYCNCANVTESSPDKTMFRRIRLDPETLIVDVADYTFSWSQGSSRVEYGGAGGCFSSVQCPQGQFSINLAGTQLRPSSEVSWARQGTVTTHDIRKVNQQKVVGKCGGYCGYCKLETGLKLDVLPP